jgi:hypothetical protein
MVKSENIEVNLLTVGVPAERLRLSPLSPGCCRTFASRHFRSDASHPTERVRTGTANGKYEVEAV